MLEFFECKETDSDSSTSGSVSQPQQEWEVSLSTLCVVYGWGLFIVGVLVKCMRHCNRVCLHKIYLNASRRICTPKTS